MTAYFIVVDKPPAEQISGLYTECITAITPAAAAAAVSWPQD